MNDIGKFIPYHTRIALKGSILPNSKLEVLKRVSHFPFLFKQCLSYSNEHFNNLRNFIKIQILTQLA